MNGCSPQFVRNIVSKENFYLKSRIYPKKGSKFKLLLKYNFGPKKFKISTKVEFLLKSRIGKLEKSTLANNLVDQSQKKQVWSQNFFKVLSLNLFFSAIKHVFSGVFVFST